MTATKPIARLVDGNRVETISNGTRYLSSPVPDVGVALLRGKRVSIAEAMVASRNDEQRVSYDIPQGITWEVVR